MKMKMGKLIDTEVLKAYVRKHGLYCDTDADKEYTCEKIDEFPTVEAIPIKWIQERIEEAASNGDTPYVKCLEWTLLIYRNEVEDGQTD